MPVLSLKDLAHRTLVRNIDTIYSVSDLPYEFCQPFLKKIDNPEQLHIIEQNCPQIAGYDAEIWRSIIKRHIPNYYKYPHEPSAENSKNWYKVYKYLLRADSEATETARQRLEERMKKIEDEREAEKTRYVPSKIVQGPRKPFSSMRVRTAPRSVVGTSLTKTTKKLTGPSASSVPYRVPLPKNLIAERKAAKEAQQTRTIPRILRDESGLHSKPIKRTFEDFVAEDELFGESLTSDSVPQRKAVAPRTRIGIKPKTIAPIKSTGLSSSPAPKTLAGTTKVPTLTNRPKLSAASTPASSQPEKAKVSSVTRPSPQRSARQNRSDGGGAFMPQRRR